MRSFCLALICIFFSFHSFSQNQQNKARWLLDPAISPDGTTIAFEYRGDLYTVSSNGGAARPLTVGDAHYKSPAWSPDGKTIAYSSDRYGNFDVYTMPASGGQSTRLTYHSADDFAYDFTPDNKHVLVGSSREAPAESVRFPGVSYFQNLYNFPVESGRPELITAAGAENARYSPDGNQIVFQDKKGYEDYFRKHEMAAISRDIWLFDRSKNTYTQLTTFKGEDRVPYFSGDGNTIYYTSGKDGDLNIYKKTTDGGAPVQLTFLKDFPVRSLSVSKNNTMAFRWKGDIYTYHESQQKPKKVSIKVQNNSGFNTITEKNINSVTEFEVNPNGKEIAFINRGEVFVTGIDDKRTKRITNTPVQERMINWSPDGKTLLFSGERDGSWNIYKVNLKRPREKYFYAATTLNTKKVLSTKAEEYQPRFSPDGKKIAYVENRNILKVLDLDSEKKTTILPEGRNYSYSDGDWSFKWSPDSKWLLVDDEKGYFSRSNTALIPADGNGKILHPVNSGFGESDAKWALNGKMMTYKSSKLGRKSLANQGSSEEDIYGIFFNQKAYDNYTLDKNEFELMQDRQKEEGDEKKEDGDEDQNEEDSDREKTDPIAINLKNLEDRKVKLTINSASISDYIMNDDASKLFYLAKFEKGYDLWMTKPRTHETKILAKMGGTQSGIQISDDGKHIFLSNKGKLVKVNAKTGDTEQIKINADMLLDPAGERRYIFNHAWRQVKKKFYDPDIHGIDWKMYHDTYAQFLPYVNNNYDFQILLSEMLGELNASHTGARYYPKHPNATHTASLGLLYDQNYDGEGIKITEVIDGGALDKADSRVKKGDLILKINDHTIAAGENWNKYLRNIRDENTLLTFKSNGETFEESVKPESLGKEHQLMYKRWIDTMEKMTDSLSNGQLGYVHVKGMNDSSFREVFADVMGEEINKKALIVDTRYNGGGWLHDDLNTFLSGKTYLKFRPQGHKTKGGEPANRWTKPSAVVMSEGNYSDAFIFPYIYKQNDLGKLIGMPVAGTGTAVWWERQIDPTIIFGIPMIATIGDEGRPTENLELQPDIKVRLPYNKFLNGEDTQLKAAVKELLKTVQNDN